MNKQITCERCGSSQDKSLFRKHKDKKNYCLDCRLIVSGINPKDFKPVSAKNNYMTELENNFSIYLNNGECKLGIDNSFFGGEKSHKWIVLNQGTSYGDRQLYSMSDEKGVAYRIFYHKQKREFEDLHINDPTYQGIGRKKFTIPKFRQFINDL